MTMQAQRAVLAFLTDTNSYGDPTLRIHTNHTHLSVIVFVGSRVFKLKRAVPATRPMQRPKSYVHNWLATAVGPPGFVLMRATPLPTCWHK